MYCICLIFFFQKENPRVWPICLPEKSNDNPNHLQFRGIKVMGYGPQDDEDLILTSVDLNVKPLPICNEKYTVGQSNRNFWEILDSLPNKFDGGSGAKYLFFSSHLVPSKQCISFAQLVLLSLYIFFLRDVNSDWK